MWSIAPAPISRTAWISSMDGQALLLRGEDRFHMDYAQRDLRRQAGTYHYCGQGWIWMNHQTSKRT